MTTPTVPPKPTRQKRVQLNMRLDPETHAVLQTILQRDGVPYTAQIVRAVRLWAKEKHVEVPHAPAPREGQE